MHIADVITLPSSLSKELILGMHQVKSRSGNLSRLILMSQMVRLLM